MKITKIITTTIKIAPHELQSSVDSLLLEKIKEKYEGRCFNGCLLLADFNILSRGDCMINKSELGGHMHVELSFSASAVIYSEEEWLVGKVVTIKDGYFFIKGEHSTTLVEYSSDYIKSNNIKVGAPIIFSPVYDGIGYVPFSKEITIIGINLFHYPEPRVFRCSEHIDKETLSPFFEQVEEARKRLPPNWKAIDAKLKKIKKRSLEPTMKVKEAKGKGYKLSDMKLFGNVIKTDLMSDEIHAYPDEAMIIETGTKVYQAYLTDTINYIELIIQYAKFA
tara:strand:- start:4067 stop:4903 length:837 start_codon:yes stop_codon:yes gene_type:complete